MSSAVAGAAAAALSVAEQSAASDSAADRVDAVGDGFLLITLVGNGYVPLHSATRGLIPVPPLLDTSMHLGKPLPASEAGTRRYLEEVSLAKRFFCVCGGCACLHATLSPSSPPQLPEGVPRPRDSGTGCAARPTAVLENARFGFRGVNDLVCDALWNLSGLDALSAATSTSLNPLQPPSAGAAAAAQLGDRAEAAAFIAASVLARSTTLLDALASLPADEFAAVAPTVPQPPLRLAAGLPSGAAVTGGEGDSPSQAERLWRGRWFALLQSLFDPAHRAELFRPGEEPAAFVGSRQPHRRWALGPHEDVPENFAWLSEELLRLGDVPSSSQTHRVIVLRNLRGCAVTVASPDAPPGDDPSNGGVPYGPLSFAWDAVHPLVASGVVRLHPMSGSIPPGGAVVVRVTLTAPAAAQVRACTLARVYGGLLFRPMIVVPPHPLPLAGHCCGHRLCRRRDAWRGAGSSGCCAAPPHQCAGCCLWRAGWHGPAHSPFSCRADDSVDDFARQRDWRALRASTCRGAAASRSRAHGKDCGDCDRGGQRGVPPPPAACVGRHRCGCPG